ncbi:hypothetical protein CDL15_Pgr012096 [Punica granatum]|uniref:Uncharacterized protein n=1 Tax=Punica granatum TaxID=22663 RepID=A0A218XMD6_PUNGR|nr:hypothetical protein CDL15_Pgr012096 [Punica granatum]
MGSQTRSFIYVWLTAIASLIYCYLVPANLRKGKPGLLSLIPAFGLFALLPLPDSPPSFLPASPPYTSHG